MEDRNLMKAWDLLRVLEDPGIKHTGIQHSKTASTAVLPVQLFHTRYPQPWFNNYLLLKIMLNVLVLEGSMRDYRRSKLSFLR